MNELEETDQLNELYRLYGIASHNCSNIEYRIVLLLLGPRWSKAEDLTLEKVTEVYEKLQTRPLGHLLNEYKKHYPLKPEQVELVGDVLEKRNYLVHRFFGTYGQSMRDPAVQETMIRELKGLIAMFQSVSRSLDPEVQGN